jgi:AcrR family transcriptional regulator/DNA-binding MarR family transcriptional regulator
VAGVQRARILSAVAEVCAQRGLARVTVSEVVLHAGVSRRTFYELFSDCEDCLLAALERSVSLAYERLEGACGRPAEPWPERVRAGLLELLAFFDEEPCLAWLLLVGWLGAGERALKRRCELVSQLTAALTRQQGADLRPSELSRMTAEGTIAAVLTALHTRVLDGKGPLLELANPLMSMIVLPYLGPGAARRELGRPLVLLPSSTKPAVGRDGFNIRVTYRTVRVLDAVARQPGSSNRTIGNAAGIRDQGQVSKVLRRLRERGLIANDGDDNARGLANAWTLTTRGRELWAALGMQDQARRARP